MPIEMHVDEVEQKVLVMKASGTIEEIDTLIEQLLWIAADRQLTPGSESAVAFLLHLDV